MTRKRVASSVIKFIVLTVILILFIVPFVFLLINSFKENILHHLKSVIASRELQYGQLYECI